MADAPLRVPNRRNPHYAPDKPWGPPSPLPKWGNQSRLRLYQAIGFALTQWEELELRLAVFYLRLLGLEYHPDGKVKTAGYEDAKGVEGRLALIDKAADTYSIKFIDQNREIEIAELIGQVRLFTLRRNDIAHGAVRWVNANGIFYSAEEHGSPVSIPCGYFLVPISQFDRKINKGGISYYNSKEIYELAQNIMELRFRVEQLLGTMPLCEKGAP